MNNQKKELFVTNRKKLLAAQAKEVAAPVAEVEKKAAKKAVKAEEAPAPAPTEE